MTSPTEPEPERLTPGVARWLLGVAYLCLASLYAWQASQRVSPSIFLIASSSVMSFRSRTQ